MNFPKYVLFSVVLLSCGAVLQNANAQTQEAGTIDATVMLANVTTEKVDSKHFDTLVNRVKTAAGGSDAKLSGEVGGAFDKILTAVFVNLVLGNTSTKVLALDCFKNLCIWGRDNGGKDRVTKSQFNQIVALVNGPMHLILSGSPENDDDKKVVAAAKLVRVPFGDLSSQMKS